MCPVMKRLAALVVRVLSDLHTEAEVGLTPELLWLTSAISHFSALCDDHVLHWLTLRIHDCPCVVNLGHYIHTLDHSTKDDVLAVQVRRAGLRCDDEELTAI